MSPDVFSLLQGLGNCLRISFWGSPQNPDYLSMFFLKKFLDSLKVTTRLAHTLYISPQIWGKLRVDSLPSEDLSSWSQWPTVGAMLLAALGLAAYLFLRAMELMFLLKTSPPNSMRMCQENTYIGKGVVCVQKTLLLSQKTIFGADFP